MAPNASATDTDAWAVVVFRVDNAWQVNELPPGVAGDLEELIAAVRGQVYGAFVMVDVSDEFFVVVRHVGGQERLLLSDASAALEWDLAAQVCERLDIDIPNEDELDEIWPAGDLGVFADLGVDEMELGAILSDVDAYADEMLSTLAQRLGFADAYEQAIDALV